MKFSPSIIWIALFALLACAAEGRGFGAVQFSGTSSDVCAAQAQIASFGDETLVCDLQRVLGCVNSDGATNSGHESTTLLVTVDPTRFPTVNALRMLIPVWAEPLPATTMSTSMVNTNVFPYLAGASPGAIMAYCLAPHAPPRAA